MAIDTKGIKSQYNIVDVIGKHVALTKKGAEYYGMCPFHDDENESLQVKESKQVFKCFACEAPGGDMFQFLLNMGFTLPEAAEEITGGASKVSSNSIQAIPKKEGPKKPTWTYVPDAPSPPASFRHFEHGEPSLVWSYKSSDGKILSYVCRFDLSDGKKEVIPFSYATDGNSYKWAWLGIPAPRPMYNLDLIAANPKATILIVEGEKTADAAQKNLDPSKCVVTTWIGGAMGIKNTDWTPLNGRKVILLPDNDTEQKYGKTHARAGEIKDWNEQPGNSAMLAIFELIKGNVDVVHWVRVPEGFPHKWDVADKEWNPGELRQFLIDNIGDVPEVITDPTSEEIKADGSNDSVIVIEYEPEPSTEPEPVTPAVKESIEPPKRTGKPVEQIQTDYFRFLGYERDENQRLVYYFFSYEAQTVIKLSPSNMSQPNLMQIAPINWWEMKFPGGGKVKVDLNRAIQFLMGTSHSIGPYREENIRGRGAWLEKDQLVIHTGENLLIDGREIPLKQYRSKYVYEIGVPLGFGDGKPIENTEAIQMLEKIKWLNWEREINAYLLAGWCVIAPFCGVLNWRPHAWLTGPAGSGKSWIMDNVVKRLMGETSIVVQGNSTEAGIRGILKSDARPILFDESDVDGQHDKERVQGVLSLARVSSTGGDTGSVVKGTASGNARSYTVRSMFFFASIGVQLKQQSDRSRFTMLSLKSIKSVKDENQFSNYHREWDQLVSDDFVQGLQARTMSLIPVIIKNAKTFSDAVAHVIGNRRIGDQVGSLLAGAWSLSSKNEISYDNAVKWVKARDWNEERGLELTRDENQLLSVIMGRILRVESAFGALERSIGELVLISSKRYEDRMITWEHAHNRLRRMGIMIIGDRVNISNTSQNLKDLIKDTSWSNGHAPILERIEGAEKMEARTFYPGHSSRGVTIPLSIILEGYVPLEEPVQPEPEPISETDEKIYTSASNPNFQGNLGFD